MENFIEIWKQICESNLFNFVVMILLLGWMIKKFDIGSKIELGRKKIENMISESEKNKENMLSELYDAQNAITKIDEEMFSIFKSAEENAKSVGEKILDEGKIQTDAIKENCKKTIDANVKTVKAEVLKETAEEALEIAELHIKSELEKNPSLHERYINESIDAIDNIGVDI